VKIKKPLMPIVQLFVNSRIVGMKIVIKNKCDGQEENNI
jgi:hypothetical protein